MLIVNGFSMEKGFGLAALAVLCCLVEQPLPVAADETAPSDDGLESRHQGQAGKTCPLQSALAWLEITGGASGGYFCTENAGSESTEGEFLLSNVLVDFSRRDKGAPLGFSVAFGETSTPSLLGNPEHTSSMDIEYASLSLTPVDGLSVQAGLLQPNAGYECTYTYNNHNALLGALASQQPYNAYGAGLGYEFGDFRLYAGYYKSRLDEEEYETDESEPNEAWELGVSGKLSDTTFSLYHYHLESQRSLTGMVIERTVHEIDFGLNLDYWVWDGGMRSARGGDSSIGAAVYIVPKLNEQFSLPVRLEYIDQGKSGIYLDSASTHQIYTVTLSPTYHLCEHAFVRADLAYVKADEGFADHDGNGKSERLCFAAELGYVF